ncbi:MAG: ABC exporter membrane fusion protein [Leptolyngbya sp. SIOISBB]|nr:ABC exporter membrane fusion protein [Leptolyngbya sp. SIOISBB]
MRTSSEPTVKNKIIKAYKNIDIKHPKLWAISLLGIAIASLLGIFLIQSIVREKQATNQVDSAESAKPQAVSALGFLRPEDEVTHLSASMTPEGARLGELMVEQGDQVEAGQILAVLDNQERLATALSRAKAQVDIARSQLRQVQAGAKDGEIDALEAQLENLDAELQGQIRAQQATIKRLESDLQGNTAAQTAINDRITAELMTAEAECNRFEQLYAQGAISESEYDLKCLEQDVAYERQVESEVTLTRVITSGQEQIAEAKAQLNRTISTLGHQQSETQATLNQVSEVRDVDVDLAQAELAAAIVGVQQAEADLELAYVRAPRSGQILKINTRPGEMITNDGIVEFGQTQQMYVIAEVYETDIARIEQGQRATVTSDALPDTLHGTVDEIGLQIGKQEVFSTNPTFDIDARVVEVKIRLDPEDSQQVSGMTNLRVEAVIDTSS